MWTVECLSFPVEIFKNYSVASVDARVVCLSSALCIFYKIPVCVIKAVRLQDTPSIQFSSNPNCKRTNPMWIFFWNQKPFGCHLLNYKRWVRVNSEMEIVGFSISYSSQFTYLFACILRVAMFANHFTVAIVVVNVNRCSLRCVVCTVHSVCPFYTRKEKKEEKTSNVQMGQGLASTNPNAPSSRRRRRRRTTESMRSIKLTTHIESNGWTEWMNVSVGVGKW